VVVDGYVGREGEGYVYQFAARALNAIIAKIEGSLAANQRE
jgi:hypothetical protein